VTAQVFLASFDVEDWFHAENLRATLAGAAWSSLEARVERNTHEVLDILAETGAKATFFVLGWIARRHPQLVRRIVAEGHEVASHSDVHARLDGLSRNTLARDLAEARDSLEQITSLPVWGLRLRTSRSATPSSIAWRRRATGTTRASTSSRRTTATAGWPPRSTRMPRWCRSVPASWSCRCRGS